MLKYMIYKALQFRDYFLFKLIEERVFAGRSNFGELFYTDLSTGIVHNLGSGARRQARYNSDPFAHPCYPHAGTSFRRLWFTPVLG